MATYLKNYQNTKKSIEYFIHKYLQNPLVLTAVIFFLLSLFLTTYESYKYTFLSYVSSPARAESKDRSLPTFINIPSVQISLPVEEATITMGVWEIRHDAASHLSSSAIPGENGNAIFYGRNSDQEFSRLTSLHIQDEILVTTMDGLLHTYTVTQLTVVSPLEISALADSNQEEITLYTSYGFGDLKRFVVKAKPVTL